MLALVKKFHAGQTRSEGKFPYWFHCERVARLLGLVLQETGEGEAERRDVILATLGHDLYEDTDVQRSEIVKRFGARVDELIEELTNRQGDDYLDEYLKKLQDDSEPGQLIKLADLCDNYLDGSFAVPVMGLEWTTGFLVPILQRQWDVLQGQTFTDYPKTAERLTELVGISREYLLGAVAQGRAHEAG